MSRVPCLTWDPDEQAECPRRLGWDVFALDEGTIDCGACRYVGLPGRRARTGLSLECRWVEIAHANGQWARDSGETWDPVGTVGEALVADLGDFERVAAEWRRP